MRREMQRWWAAACTAFLACLVCVGARAAPVTIEYELVALATPGRFEARYTVINDALAAGLNWFAIDFDPTLYDEASLQIVSGGGADWTAQVLGSLPGVPAQFDLFKSTGAPLAIGESATGFAIDFTWLGTGGPGAQVFSVYDATTLDVIASGRTSAAGTPPTGVPEPRMLALVLMALAAAGAARERAGHRQAKLSVQELA